MSQSPDLQRYRRQLLLPELGEAGQRKLAAARVLLVGLGGLGSPAALYLTAAGVGTLGLVDFDAVDASNLHRQVLYGDADVGRPKLEAARQRLTEVNAQVRLETHALRLAADNALELVQGYDLVLDGSDNFATRYVVNDACVLAGVPNVHASIHRFEGQVTIFGARHVDGTRGPCYRCLFPTPPPAAAIPNCAEAGVLGVLPGVLGLLQATEAIKWLTGMGTPLIGRLLLYDALAMQTRTMRLTRNPACALCGDTSTLRTVRDEAASCAATVGIGEQVIETEELHALLTGGQAPLLIDVREASEIESGMLPGAMHVPLSRLVSASATLPHDKMIIVYCQSGIRSANGADVLRRAGLHARSLGGGIIAWRAAASQRNG